MQGHIGFSSVSVHASESGRAVEIGNVQRADARMHNAPTSQWTKEQFCYFSPRRPHDVKRQNSALHCHPTPGNVQKDTFTYCPVATCNVCDCCPAPLRARTCWEVRRPTTTPCTWGRSGAGTCGSPTQASRASRHGTGPGPHPSR